jgi:hypothetical protein
MRFKDLPAPLIPTSQHFDSLKLIDLCASLWNDDRAAFILLLNYSYTAGYDKFNPAFYSVFVGAGSCRLKTSAKLISGRRHEGS